MTPMPLRRRSARWLDSPAMLQPELITLMWAAIRGYHAEPKFPGVLTAPVKRAEGHDRCSGLDAEAARRLTAQKVAEAIEQARSGRPAPYKPSLPMRP